MVRYGLMLAACLSLSVSAQQKAAVKKSIADSVVYDKPTEWRVFAQGAPVSAFTLQKDNLWYITKGAVISSNIKKSEVAKFPKLGTVSAEDLTCIVGDAGGKIWIGGKNGLAVKSGTTFTNYTAENGLPDVSVNALAVANDGAVWVGTDSGVAVFQNNQWKVYKTADGIVSDKATAITIDNKGAVWIGSDKGISIYENGAFKIQNMKSGMSWNNVKALAADPKTGVIWAAVGEKDVNCFENGTWKVYMDIQADITSIMADTHSRIWFGSATGIVKFNGEEWITDPKQIGVPATQVNAMYRDAGGNLWFAMENGVVRLDNPYPF